MLKRAPFRDRRTSLRLHQRGLSIVEILVGAAVGLFIVAGAAMLVGTNLSENRKLVIDAQIQQDLRATADIITRELRRAGTWRLSENGVWVPDAAPTTNLGIAVAPLSTPATQVDFRYERISGAQGQSVFKLEDGRIKSLLTLPAGWQDLTDRNVMVVTAFSVTPRHVDEPSGATYAVEKLPCPKLCADTTTNCWPTLRVREFQIDITGQSALDASVQRSVRTIVRLRNDHVAPAPGSASLCPA